MAEKNPFIIEQVRGKFPIAVRKYAEYARQLEVMEDLITELNDNLGMGGDIKVGDCTEVSINNEVLIYGIDAMQRYLMAAMQKLTQEMKTFIY